MKKNGSKMAKIIKRSLDFVLKTEANTASSLMVYQPKAPKELEKFRRL